jgi:hydrogenase expression/formation protein HypC
MCFAVPAKVLRVAGESVVVDFGGQERTVKCALGEGVNAGDYVILRADYAVERLTPAEAKKSLKLWGKILGDA